MITHSMLDLSGIPRIGLWLHNGIVIAAATYDCSLGSAFLLALPEYAYLYEEMLRYAKTNLHKNGRFRVMIPDHDSDLQEIAAQNSFYPTQDRDFDAVYPIDLQKITYSLPEGYRITSMKENFDIYQYGRVLWQGFNHEVNGEGPFNPSPEDLAKNELEFKRPNVNLDLKIAVVAPNGDFVSYCGMWQDAGSSFALVEPVATDPAYRKMGLGRAAVLEAVRRCGKLGAQKAFVGSSQSFYYHIGFRPYATATWWEQKQAED